MRQPHESDLTISEIKSDEATLYITMEQKENPNYNNYGKVWYAVVDKMLLRNDVKIVSKYLDIENPGFVKINDLPDNYSIEQALIDGCFVEKDYMVLSENKYAIDELMEKAKKGEESSIRIYSKDGNHTSIMDLFFKNNVFIVTCIDDFENEEFKKFKSMSFPYLKKEEESFDFNNASLYSFSKYENSIEYVPFIRIYQ